MWCVYYVQLHAFPLPLPFSFYCPPFSRSMKALGVTYWISQKGKELQTMLEKEYELPTYTVYMIIAVATIVVGLLLGGVSFITVDQDITWSKME